MARRRTEQTADARWTITPDGEISGFSPANFGWFTPGADPRARCVKGGAGRSTWRVELAARPGTEGVTRVAWYAKLFGDTQPDQHVGQHGDTQRNARSGSGRQWIAKARREFEVLELGRARGVEMVSPAALGIHENGASAVLVTIGLEPSVPLSEWEGDPRGGVPSAVARLLAAAHVTGFTHPDGHAGNILLVTIGDPRAAYVDVAGARFSPASLPQTASAASIAQLDQFFHLRLSRTVRLRFLKEYLAFRDRSHELRAWTTAVIEQRRILAERLARHRDRRMWRNNRYFAGTALADGWSGRFVLTLERRHLFPESGVPDRSLEQWRKTAWDVARDRAPDRWRSQGVRIHRETASGLVDRLVWLWKGTPAMRAFKRCHAGRHRDRAEPLILGYLEHWTYGLPRECVTFVPSNGHHSEESKT